MATRKERALLKGPHPFTSVAYAPDGKTLVTGSGIRFKPGVNPIPRGEAMLWDAATGQLRATLKVDTGPVKALAFTPDGKTLATGLTDGTVKFWDVTNLSKVE